MVIDFSSFLPVNWLGVTGEHLPSNKNLLVWTVAQEENCGHYIIRRSLELNHHPEWKLLGTIDCDNRLEVHQHSYIDNNPPPVGYYQIVQYDYNSENSKSWIIPIWKKEEQLTPFPNPSDTYFTLNTKGVSRLEIINSLGKIVDTKDLGSETRMEIDVSAYTPGVYFIRLYYANRVRLEKVSKL